MVAKVPVLNFLVFKVLKSHIHVSYSYTILCLSVRGDNLQALASLVDIDGINILYTCTTYITVDLAYYHIVLP